MLCFSSVLYVIKRFIIWSCIIPEQLLVRLKLKTQQKLAVRDSTFWLTQVSSSREGVSVSLLSVPGLMMGWREAEWETSILDCCQLLIFEFILSYQNTECFYHKLCKLCVNNQLPNYVMIYSHTQTNMFTLHSSRVGMSYSSWAFNYLSEPVFFFFQGRMLGMSPIKTGSNIYIQWYLDLRV